MNIGHGVRHVEWGGSSVKVEPVGVTMKEK